MNVRIFYDLRETISAKGGASRFIFYTGKNVTFRIKSYRKIGGDCLRTASYPKTIQYENFVRGYFT